MPSKHTLALVIGLSLSTSAIAQEYRQHDAHVHGQIEFNIAQDGKDLLIEITAPGADVVGFEHPPENAEQKQVLKNVVAKLEDANSLFAINPQAKCDVTEALVNHTLDDEHEEHGDHGHEGHDHDEHAHDDHDEHHDNDGHDEHDDHEGHDHDEHNGHGEFSVQYRFNCEQVSELSSIKTGWFNQFPATESVSVNLFTDTTQSATNLSKDNAEIKIK
ncbi:zinc uptake protein ZrgA [Vibrio sp. FJH11]